MNSKTVTLAAMLVGIGCSHATPKPVTQPTALASRLPSSARSVAKQAVSENTTFSAHHDDSAGNAIFFDFDSALLRDDARSMLQQVGKELVHSQHSIRIEGNCDERGTTEYNLALGDQRAREAKNYLERLGIADRRISIMSYGSERPKARGHDETAWAQNRRDDFVIR
jgi:peptidoglycan-associated lipoprotein